MFQKILIYLDILGFEELPKIIGNEKGIESSLVRENLIKTIQEKIQMLNSNGYIQGSKYGDSDDWLLAIEIGDELDEYETIIRVISAIMNHDSGFSNYEKIPLSIIIGTAKYNEEIVLDGKKLICEDGTIEFLKLNLTSKYKNWYSAQNPSSRITSTYVLATETIYEFMETLDKESCTIIEQDSTKFYEIDYSYIIRRNKLFNFLESINLLGSKIYNRIDDIFVPAQCYENIKEKMEKERIVIITGPPELGKTYTAVRLLWEYYLNDFKPKWYLGEEITERKDSRQKLIEIQRELKLKIALDPPQLITGNNINLHKIGEKDILHTLKPLREIRHNIKALHLWGKKIGKTGKFTAHVGDLNTFFSNNQKLKGIFLEQLKEVFNDSKPRYFVPEVNGSVNDLHSIVNDMIRTGFTFV